MNGFVERKVVKMTDNLLTLVMLFLIYIAVRQKGGSKDANTSVDRDSRVGKVSDGGEDDSFESET